MAINEGNNFYGLGDLRIKQQERARLDQEERDWLEERRITQAEARMLDAFGEPIICDMPTIKPQIVMNDEDSHTIPNLYENDLRDVGTKYIKEDWQPVEDRVVMPNLFASVVEAADRQVQVGALVDVLGKIAAQRSAAGEA